MNPHHPLAATYEQMLHGQLPNFFRLHLNSFVAQTCLCLERYVQATWNAPQARFQSFLANSFDEALSGAIKLARYSASVAGRPTQGLVIDPADRLGPFAGVTLPDGRTVEFLPGLSIVREPAALPAAACGFVVLVAANAANLEPFADMLRALNQRDAPQEIVCVDRAALTALRQNAAALLRRQTPDIVVFDESFVNRDVPFSAFTARQGLYDHWNKRGKGTFHSTTFQPNTISTLHFLKCLENDDAAFHAALAPELAQVDADSVLRGKLFRRLYSPSLAKATRLAGCATAVIQARGDFVTIDGRRVFDAVSGVACSIRGHNPEGYAQAMTELAATDCVSEVTARLHELTGLANVLPAVSGASGVETALKLALVAQHPRRRVLALKSGYGGKTLFALTATAHPSYKQHIGPLYADVRYVDPFAADALQQIDAELASGDVAVVQVELIQGVGGVRRVPEAVVRHLAERRKDAGFLLVVDEVQTGMYRTGPFTLSRALGVLPDVLVLGKGVSDMMFPFALVLYGKAVEARLAAAGSTLPEAIRQRYGYEIGYRTVLNVLLEGERLRLPERVATASALFASELGTALANCAAVRAVRIHGLLIGIELDDRPWPQRWLRKRLFWFYLSAMLRHPRFPVLVGFCQYEPNVLKITPALTVDAATIRAACATIGEVLRRPLHRLAAAALGDLLRPRSIRNPHEHRDDRALEPVAH